MKPLPPIYSTHDEDLSMRDAIEGFVIGLAERIDDLQDAELQGNLTPDRFLLFGPVDHTHSARSQHTQNPIGADGFRRPAGKDSGFQRLYYLRLEAGGFHPGPRGLFE